MNWKKGGKRYLEQISVIVPVYNVEKYLLRCIDSIRRQTHSNLEIILVDDGSLDRCGEMCDSIAHQDSRVKVLHKKNEGLGFARNAGLTLATGDYVVFIDSDDWISENHIENLYRIAKENHAELVIGAHTTAFRDGTFLERPIPEEKNIVGSGAVIGELLLPLIGPDTDYPGDVQVEASSCMNLYRLDIIHEHMIRFPSERQIVSEDLFFNIDYLFYCRSVVLRNEMGYFYYENLSSISRSYDSFRFRRILNSYEKLHSKIDQYGLKEKIGFRIERCYLMNIRVAISHIVSADISFWQKYREIKEILQHNTSRLVLKKYPVDTYVPALRLSARVMKSRSVLGMYCLVKLRKLVRNLRLWDSLLKWVGLGK